MVARAAALCLHTDAALILFRELSLKIGVYWKLTMYSGLSDFDFSNETDASKWHNPIW